MSTGWEFFLGRSSDMAILARITDATEKSLNPIFNQKGSFSCTVKIDSAAALLAQKWKHCIILQRPDGTAAWSGPIVGIVDSAVAGATQLSAQGWQSELDYRWIRSIAELQAAIAYVTPEPVGVNPSFDTNTTGWTATTSTITRDTSVFDSTPASGRWDNTGANDNLGTGDQLDTTFSGTFFAGVQYKLKIKMKANSTVLAGNLAISFGDIISSDIVSTSSASIGTSFAIVQLVWTPSATTTTGALRFVTDTGYRYWIDTVVITGSYKSTVPTVSNTGFESTTSNWSPATSTITRDTAVYAPGGSASGRWDNTGASDNLGANDALVGTITGTFLAGISYKLKIKIKPSVSTASNIIIAKFGTGSDYGITAWFFNSPSLGTDWRTKEIWWTPIAEVSAGLAISLISNGGAYYNIDDVIVEQVGGFPQETTFSEINDGDIGEALVRLANLQTDSSGTVRATHLNPNGTATTPRTRTYQVGQNIGAAIRELSEIENGFDIAVDPSSREIAFKPNTSFVDQTDIVYGYNTVPRNLDDVVVNDDGTTEANSINVQAAFTIGNADSPTAIADTGVLLEDWLSASDIKDIAIVGAYANEELVFRVGGQMTIAAKPSPGAPMPYIDYDWGDKVYISANKGRMQLDRQAARVFSGRISWNSQNEPVLDELGLTP